MLPIIKCPPDKSLSHRALIFAALANGESEIRSLSKGLDVQATRKIIEAFGTKVQAHNQKSNPELDPCALAVERLIAEDVSITPKSGAPLSWVQANTFKLDCHNSGTSARLMMGLCAAVDGLRVCIDGDASLRNRPMRRVLDGLVHMGLSSKFARDHLPLEFVGIKPQCSNLKTDRASAQIKSAWILAALFARKNTTQDANATIIELPPGARTHTETMLQSLGVDIRSSLENRDGLMRELIKIKPLEKPWSGFSISIPGDPSSAVFWALIAQLAQVSLRIPHLLLNKNRLSWMNVLQTAGLHFDVEVSKDNSCLGEDSGHLTIHAVPMEALRPISIDSIQSASMIDELPTLACFAALAKAPSLIEGIGELRVKESDRVEGIQSLTKVLGATTFCERDRLTITPQSCTPTPTVDAKQDHRIAMLAHILKKFKNNNLHVFNADEKIIAVSDPGFLKQLEDFE